MLDTLHNCSIIVKNWKSIPWVFLTINLPKFLMRKNVPTVYVWCCHLQCYHINGCVLSVFFQHNRRTSLRKWTQIKICFPLLQKQLTNKHRNFQNKNGIFKPFKFHLILPLYIEYTALKMNTDFMKKDSFF